MKRFTLIPIVLIAGLAMAQQSARQPKFVNADEARLPAQRVLDAPSSEKRTEIAPSTPGSELQGWAPPDIDQVVPPARRDLPCPLDDVVRSASERVKQLVVNLQQFSATEVIAASEVDKKGKVHSTRSGSFEYLAQIDQLASGKLAVQEYRNGTTSPDLFPSKVATTGTAASALIFHPIYLHDFTIECEGFTTWHDHPSWQVHFLQRADRANNFRTYWANGVRYPARLKGRAWISADSYQVVRLETELAEPIKDIVQREIRIIEYRPVPFPKRNLELWLPENAELFLEYRKHRFHNRQTFSDFQLFWVEATQKDKLPNPTPQ